MDSRFIKKMTLSFFGVVILLSYQNCSKVSFEENLSSSELVGNGDDTPADPVDCLSSGADGTATCAGKVIYFIGGVAQVLGNTLNPTDETGAVQLEHPFNGKNARVRVYMYPNGRIEVRPSIGNKPWMCLDQAQAVGVLLQHKNRDGSPGGMAENCYSPIRWYSSDGQQGFALDTYGDALAVQKNAKNEVYRRGNPTASGEYITNMVLAPPERAGKNLIWVQNINPCTGFMMHFTGLYSGVWPYPASATHLKVYDYKSAYLADESAWTDLLIENTPVQLAAAKDQGYEVLGRFVQVSDISSGALLKCN